MHFDRHYPQLSDALPLHLGDMVEQGLRSQGANPEYRDQADSWAYKHMGSEDSAVPNEASPLGSADLVTPVPGSSLEGAPIDHRILLSGNREYAAGDDGKGFTSQDGKTQDGVQDTQLVHNSNPLPHCYPKCLTPCPCVWNGWGHRGLAMKERTQHRGIRRTVGHIRISL